MSRGELTAFNAGQDAAAAGLGVTEGFAAWLAQRKTVSAWPMDDLYDDAGVSAAASWFDKGHAAWHTEHPE